jgi:hypothetical protein
MADQEAAKTPREPNSGSLADVVAAVAAGARALGAACRAGAPPTWLPHGPWRSRCHRRYVALVWIDAREPVRDVPAASTTGAPPPPVRALGSPAVAALQLQRAAGNAATARLLSVQSVQRTSTETAEAEAKPALERIREINDSAWAGPLDELELELQWGSIPDLETMLLKPAHWDDFSRSLKAGMDLDKVKSCSPLVRIWVIHEFGGPDDAGRLAELWDSMDDFLGTAKQYFPTWRTSIRYGMEPDDVAVVTALKGFLEDDVRLLAEDYLTRNLAMAREERAKLGLKVVPPEHDPTAARDELVRNAGLLRELVDARKSLRDIAVGWGFEDGMDEEGAPATLRVPFAFDPAVEPDEPPEPGDPMLPWGAVNGWNEDVTDSILAVAGTSPVLYGALEADRLDELDPSVPPEDVAATAGALLFELETNILETRENLKGSLDWRDLSPIIGDLTQGGLAGTVDWSEPFYESLVRDEVGDYETTRTLEEIGWMLPAVALMFTPVGWPALVAGGLLSAAEVASKYRRWDDLRAAAGPGRRPTPSSWNPARPRQRRPSWRWRRWAGSSGSPETWGRSRCARRERGRRWCGQRASAPRRSSSGTGRSSTAAPARWPRSPRSSRAPEGSARTSTCRSTRALTPRSSRPSSGT